MAAQNKNYISQVSLHLGSPELVYHVTGAISKLYR